MNNCQDNKSVFPEALWKALMNLPALRYMKAPVDNTPQLYEKYPVGNEKGAFAFVHDENTFYTYHPRGVFRGQWKPISADSVSSFFEIDAELLKEGDILVYDSNKKKFVVKSGNVWNKLLNGLQDTFSQVTKFLNQVDEIPTDESDSGIYYVHKDENDIEFRALYIVLGKKAIKIFSNSDYYTKDSVESMLEDERYYVDAQIQRIEENMANLGIRKTYVSYEAMQADVNSPVGDDGQAIRGGELVMVVNLDDNSKDGVYRYKIVNNVKSWEYASGIGIVGELNDLRSYINQVKLDINTTSAFSSVDQKQLHPSEWNPIDNSIIGTDNKITLKGKGSSDQVKIQIPNSVTVGQKYILIFNVRKFNRINTTQNWSVKVLNFSQSITEFSKDGLFYSVFTANVNGVIQLLLQPLSTTPNAEILSFYMDFCAIVPYSEDIENAVKEWAKMEYTDLPLSPIQSFNLPDIALNNMVDNSFVKVQSQADRVLNQFNNDKIAIYSNLVGASDGQYYIENNNLIIKGTNTPNDASPFLFRSGFNIDPVNYATQNKTYVFVVKGSVKGSNIASVNINANYKEYVLLSDIQDNTETEFEGIVDCNFTAGTSGSNRYANMYPVVKNNTQNMPIIFTMSDFFIYEKIEGWSIDDYLKSVGKTILVPIFNPIEQPVENPFFVWNAIGDSITVADWMKFVGLLDTSRTYVIRNFGIGGTTLAKVTGRTDSMAERYSNMEDSQTTSVTVVDKGVVLSGVYNNASIAPYLAKVNGRVDLITLAGGTNDVGYSYKVGELGDKDITTIIGAVSTILEAWFNDFPLAKKLIILPPESDHPNRWGQIKAVEPIVKAIIEASNYYNIPFANTYYESGINKFTMTGAVNLFNTDNATVGKKIDTDGSIISDVNYTISGNIEVSSITTLTSNFGQNTRFACFDASNTLLGVINWSPAIMYQEQNYPLPTGTNYVIGSFATTNKNIIWVGNYDGALMPDRVHPNTAGQKNIASIVWMCIKKILGF